MTKKMKIHHIFLSKRISLRIIQKHVKQISKFVWLNIIDSKVIQFICQYYY